MHSIKNGATDRSYGLQVAELEGLPDAALEYARDRLAALEARPSGNIVDAECHPAKKPSSINKTAQLDLFSPGQAIQSYLSKLDLDAMTPRDALQHLYAMSDLAN